MSNVIMLILPIPRDATSSCFRISAQGTDTFKFWRPTVYWVWWKLRGGKEVVTSEEGEIVTHDDNGDNGGGSDNGIDGGSSLPDNNAPCGYWARQDTFGLPGLYYNGTLTIRHNMTHNTAWDDENKDLVTSECDNDDRSPKSYEYPAMILIAPTGNESDTNPMHWVLRGFQPSHQQPYRQDDIDFLQRWVYVRSSDFVVTNKTYLYDTPYRPFFADHLEETGATKYDQTTRVYWKTTVASDDGGTFSAQAVYTEMPPLLDVDNPAYRNSPDWRAGLRTSQYITLSDVCKYNQKLLDDWYDEDDIEAIHDAAGQAIRRQENDIWEATEPTVWLEKGATVEMEDIGAEKMRWTLQATLDKAVPWKGARKGGVCSDTTPFEFSDFVPFTSRNNDENSSVEASVPWNITLDVSLLFEGLLIKANSTTLDGEEDGKLLFGMNSSWSRKTKITKTVQHPFNPRFGDVFCAL